MTQYIAILLEMDDRNANCDFVAGGKCLVSWKSRREKRAGGNIFEFEVLSSFTCLWKI